MNYVMNWIWLDDLNILHFMLDAVSCRLHVSWSINRKSTVLQSKRVYWDPACFASEQLIALQNIEQQQDHFYKTSTAAIGFVSRQHKHVSRTRVRIRREELLRNINKNLHHRLRVGSAIAAVPDAIRQQQKRSSRRRRSTTAGPSDAFDQTGSEMP